MQPGTVIIDLHGKNRYQAKIIIDSRLRTLPKSVYRLRIIHGHTMGTELRDLVRETYQSHPRVLRIEPGPNAGVTDLVLRELYG